MYRDKNGEEGWEANQSIDWDVILICICTDLGMPRVLSVPPPYRAWQWVMIGVCALLRSYVSGSAKVTVQPPHNQQRIA